ncbi:substrate-binding domain-containing protein [Paraburkholderia bannensis]|uniref:substrate-binding domain-containing protein n=1 Tax=Paraburkholderia bannensis TaxID=765414 RepID=UPI002AB6E408|nr:substrate-binding domain-containing protein [Paraburkholderia bannensis]
MKRRSFLKSTIVGGIGAAVGVSGTIPSSASAESEMIKVALMTPLSGPGGIYGKNCKDCATLAVDELNTNGGILGRKVRLVIGDTGVSPADSAQLALRMWKRDKVDVFISNTDSAGRTAMENVLRGQVPHIYTPLYEGGDCAPGTFFLAETPDHQVKPAIPWFATERKAKRWFLIGNDYLFPRQSNAVAKEVIGASGCTVVGEEYVPFSVDNFDSTLTKIRVSGADAVFITLMGGSSVTFNRSFASFGLSENTLRFGTVIDESLLAGIGSANSRNLYSTAGFFSGTDIPSMKAFDSKFAKQFGSTNGLSAVGESIYEGFLFLHAVSSRAGSLALPELLRASEGVQYTGPRGKITMRSRHTVCDIYLAKADGSRFDIVTRFDQRTTRESCKLA